MPLLSKKVETRRKSYVFCRNHLINVIEELRKHFVETFPKEKLKELTLEEYALGRSLQGSFSWWLEYNTVQLGSILVNLIL